MPDSNGTKKPGGIRRLVIVESPAKAKTIAGYLGSGYVVESSIGHIRDMPDQAAEIPPKYKGEAWARLGVNVDHDFEPLYVVNADKKQQVAKLKKLLKDADELLLATDEDREGEAIAWHLLEDLKPKVPVHRHGVPRDHPRTPSRAAVASPRELDIRLVDAHQTRRVLDRLYGYEVCPVLWKKVMPKLSAGRVQSRRRPAWSWSAERERIAFVAGQYWDLAADFDTRQARAGPHRRSPPRSLTVDGKRVAQGRDFTSTGPAQVRRDAAPGRGGRARRWPSGCDGRPFEVKSVERKPYKPQPVRPVPYHHAAAGGQRASWASRPSTRCQVAQRLYENGFITYMRTDSITLSKTAITAARSQAQTLYGADYVPGQAARLHKQGQERPGGARGDPPGRGPVPHAGRDRPVRRPVPAVRADLEAHRRLPDEGRHRRVGLGPRAGQSTRGETRRVRRLRQDHHLLRLPQGLRRGLRRPGRRPGRPGAPAAAAGRGRPADRDRAGRRGARHPAARALHRGDRWSRSWKTARSAARRRTRRSSARSSTAATSSRRAPRWCPRSWRSPWSTCWRSTSASWSTTTSPPGWRTVLDEIARGEAERVPLAAPVLLRRRTATRASRSWSATSATSTPGRSARSRSPAPTSWSGSAGTGPTWSATASGSTCPRTSRRTS